MLSKATIKHLTRHLNETSRVILRADFNVPIKDGMILDPNRITGTNLISQPLFPQFKPSWTIGPNHWSFFLTWEGQMAAQTQLSLSSLSKSI